MRPTKQAGALSGITREEIETAAAREAFTRSPVASPEWVSEDALERSLEASLANWNGRDDILVFGYGSLIWNPCLEHVGRQLAVVHGYHRRFCLWSCVYRGTPERPGLVLALDRGGSVKGMLYRIPAARARDELRLLWRREMLGGSYQARWVRARLLDTEEDQATTVAALAFVVNHAAPAYAGHLPEQEVVERLATCSGRYGSGADYLIQTEAALHVAGILDPYLERLCQRLRERQLVA